MAKNKWKNISIIDKGETFDGTLSCRGKLVIKGSVKGTINGESVIITPEAEVCASAKAINMTVGGRFEGEIVAENQLIIMSTGDCSGKITCRDLIIEAGGVLDADVTCTAFQEYEPESDDDEGEPEALGFKSEPDETGDEEPGFTGAVEEDEDDAAGKERFKL